jgi:diguanylate cyclase (GGDEF)-like protein/PAS domain S-box-containing protein
MARIYFELFALDEEVTAMESALAEKSGTERLHALVALAWHLRQRDCTRALELANEASTLLPALEIEKTTRISYLARIQLVRAEIKALFADLVGAEQQCYQAISKFESLGDPLGAGDGQWLLVSIGFDQGNREKIESNLDLLLHNYINAADSVRIDAARARTIAQSAYGNADGAAEELQRSFPDTNSCHDAAKTWVLNAQGNIAAFTDDPGAAIKFDLQTFHTARHSGQIRHALLCAANAAEGFATLGDLDAALEWSENALSLSRATRWPGSIGVCLSQTGDVMRMLGRYDEANEFLHEALGTMEGMGGSRAHQNLLGTLGQLALDIGNNEAAFARFQQLALGLDGERNADLLMESLRGRATALSRLGRPDEAMQHAEQGLQLARRKNHADEQIKTLHVFAELHRDHNLPTPTGMKAPSAVLHYLNQALDIADKVSGYALPAEILNQVASEYAACEDYKAAYEHALAAREVRRKMRVADAQKRALAMQIRREIDRARTEAEQHMKVAAALQEANATLETLGLIGREITASLDTTAVFEALHRHVDRLLDSISFGIYLLEADGDTFYSAFGAEKGRTAPFPRFVIPVDDPTSYVARCIRERREIVVDQVTSDDEVRVLPGTLPTMSMLFAPLVVGNRMLGAMTIQSQTKGAYHERECSIFRTLSAYGAIALDNAAAYHAVEAARHQTTLHEQELRIAATAFESQEGMLISDAKHVILRVNSAFTRITGYSPEEVLGQYTTIFRTPKHEPEFYSEMRSLLDGTGTWQGEMWMRRKSGETFPLWLSISAVRSSDGNITHYVHALVDITERKLAEDEIRNLAFYDPLTRLPNRRLLMERLRHALATGKRNGSEGALLFIDLDNFKKLNDTRGHDIGDLLLEAVGGRLEACLRQGDTAARLGGDEFVVLLEDLSTEAIEAADAAEAVAEKIQATLKEPYLLQGAEHHSTSSIGVSLFKSQDITAEDLLKQGDLAMYQAKAAGRNAIRFFDPIMQEAVSTHAAMESDLRRALLDQQFVLYYQAQVDTTGKPIGAEALVRWQHPHRGMISPADFIPLAEETGLILPLGDWVLDRACQQLRQWQERPGTSHLTIAVNISARQFHDIQFVDKVLAAVEKHDIDAHMLKLELTESMLLKDVGDMIVKMRALMTRGVRFSLDDFGTGYSSLSYLKRLPLEQLKIDQSFVRDIFVDPNDLAIVQAIVTLGRSLGLSVIAEGVETKEQCEFLKASGCHSFQGYLFDKPSASVEKFELVSV